MAMSYNLVVPVSEIEVMCKVFHHIAVVRQVVSLVYVNTAFLSMMKAGNSSQKLFVCMDCSQGLCFYLYCFSAFISFIAF